MEIIFSTHQGVIYQEVIDYFVVNKEDGEFAILNNHIPTISVINEGYIKIICNDTNLYIAVTNALLEFHTNKAVILSQECHVGRSKESALQQLKLIREERLNANRTKEALYTKNENMLYNELKKAKAGHL